MGLQDTRAHAKKALLLRAFAYALLISACVLLDARRCRADDLDLIFDRVGQTLEILAQPPVERLITIMEQRLEIIEEESAFKTSDTNKFLKQVLGREYSLVKDEGYTLALDPAFLKTVLEDYSPDVNEQNKLWSEYVISRWNVWDCQDIAFYTLLARLYVKTNKTEKLVELLNKFSPKTGNRTFLDVLLRKGPGIYANIRRERLVELYRIGLEYLARKVTPDRLEQWVDDMAKWDEEGKVNVGRIEIPGNLLYPDMPGETHRLRATTLRALFKFKKDGNKNVLDALERDVALLLETMLRRGQFDIASDELLYLNRIERELKQKQNENLDELYITLMPINQKNLRIKDEKDRRNRERLVLWDRKREELFSSHPELQYMDEFLQELKYKLEEGDSNTAARKIEYKSDDTPFEQNKVIIYLLTSILDELGE